MGKAALISFVEPAGLWRNLVILDGRELYRFGVSGKPYFDAPEAVDADRLFEEVVGKPVPRDEFESKYLTPGAAAVGRQPRINRANALKGREPQ